MSRTVSLLLSAALVAGSAWLAHPTLLRAQGTTQSEQDRERSTEAYRDGYRHGQDDARAGVRNDSPGDRWTLAGDQMAWRDGYSTGYQEIAAQSPPPSGVSSQTLNSDPMRYGYEDGLAQGRADQRKGKTFAPTGSRLYSQGDHGWSVSYGEKDHYKQVYREAYAKGYQEGFNGNVPR